MPIIEPVSRIDGTEEERSVILNAFLYKANRRGCCFQAAYDRAMVKRDSSSKKEHRPRVVGKGKQPKNFLNKDAALDLAAAIAGVQEEKTLSRTEKNQQAQAGQPHSSDQKPRISASKVKLKETKALLAARRTQSKREKAKRKKEREQPFVVNHERTPAIAAEAAQTRKRVSFA